MGKGDKKHDVEKSLTKVLALDAPAQNTNEKLAYKNRLSSIGSF